VIRQFELDWMGGAAETRLRRRRPGIDDLPWGTLAALNLDDPTARMAWTDGAFSEYASAAAFSALTTALLEAGAPIDLVAMTADFAVDELVHVELNGRMAAELGGAAPYRVDLERVSPHRDDDLPAIERAAELAVTVSCIGEALSVPALAGSLRAATHPLTRAVLRRIVRDEKPHAGLGWMILDWAGARVDRARLARVARARLEAYAPMWLGPACPDAAPERRGIAGLMAESQSRRTLRAAARRAIAALAARGVVVEADGVA